MRHWCIWADAMVIASPIRWGSASSLYFKMVERLDCVRTRWTIRNEKFSFATRLRALSSWVDRIISRRSPGDARIFR